MRGTIAHLIFEVLTKPRHEKYIKNILKNKTSTKTPSVYRLIQKSAKKMGINLLEMAELATKDEIPKTHLECIDEMIIVGLKFDFLNYKKVLGAEVEFDITNEYPKYRIGGFIDRIFEEDGSLIIRDFKSSKKPFTAAELKDNLQAMMYSLAAKKTYKQYKNILVKFLFLRHPRNPERSSPAFSNEELQGFEYYLQYITEHLSQFNEKTATSNFAANDFKKKWMCKTNSGWKCPYLEPFEYKILLNKKNEIVKSIFAHEEFSESDLNSGLEIKNMTYAGCPAWNAQNSDFNL